MSAVTIYAGAALTLLITGCHPEGLYGPKAFGYNTQGVVVSNLFGRYRFDGANAQVLSARGLTDHSGYIELKPDMTFVFSNIPSVMAYPKTNLYYSATGKWQVVKHNTIWALEVNSIQSGTIGYASYVFPILNESAPHGIELNIDDDEGYWIRYSKYSADNLTR